MADGDVPLTAIQLVFDFLEAKKLESSAAALRKDIEALQTSLRADVPAAEPVERGFSQLEALLTRTKAHEAESYGCGYRCRSVAVCFRGQLRYAWRIDAGCAGRCAVAW